MSSQLGTAHQFATGTGKRQPSMTAAVLNSTERSYILEEKKKALEIESSAEAIMCCHQVFV